jgi:hypothetical protein
MFDQDLSQGLTRLGSDGGWKVKGGSGLIQIPSPWGLLICALHLDMDIWCQFYVSEDLFIIPPKRGTSESQYQYCIAYIILVLEYTTSMESLIVSFHFVPTLSLPPYF